MKKITSVLVLTLFILSAKAEGDDRKVRFGLTGSGSLSWIKPDNKYMKRKGLKAGYSYGLLLDLNMGKNYAFATGLQIVNSGGTISYLNDTLSIPTELVAGERNYYWASSDYKYSITDIELPISLKLKTNEIGYLTYFGQIGLVTNFRYKSKYSYSYSETEVKDGDLTDTQKAYKNQRLEGESKLDANQFTTFFRSSMLVMVGAEYNLTGNTSVVFSLGFKNGFSPFSTFKKKTFVDFNNDGTISTDRDNSKKDSPDHYANNTLTSTSSSSFVNNGYGLPLFDGPVKKGFTNQIVLNVGIFF